MTDQERQDQNKNGDFNIYNGSDPANDRDRLRQAGNEGTALPPGIARVGNTGAEGHAAEKIIDRDDRRSQRDE